ncbi:Protein OPI10 [Spathaspora sp. JA1]|nr:Protein OPI10 [Spathaspora sp. JA1]
MSLFGAVCSGRPVQMAQQVENTKYVITVPNASNVSYVTVFLLPNSTFVDTNFTAVVYFQLPNSQEYKLLGGIGPSKPSAIYKLNNNSTKIRNQNDEVDMDMGEGPVDATDTAVINIGISIEASHIAEQLINQAKAGQASSSTAAPKPVPSVSADTVQLANKVVGHAYNYLSGFVDTTGKVPIKTFESWWDKFKLKLNNNPNFLNELQD